MLSDRAGPPPPDSADGFIPEVVSPLPRTNPLARNLPWTTAFGWVRAGWGDMLRNPLPSLAYGAGMVVLSLLVVWFLFSLRLDYLLLPALAGFLVVGPLIACGLYEKSRRLEAGEPVTLASMVSVRPRSGISILFAGVLLLCLFLLWMRAAVILYAVFFGVAPFPGTGEIVRILFLTLAGWGLILVGTAVGALFAAFAFAISALSFPMMLNERTDALSAMGISIATVWNNLPVMLGWGAIVMALFAVAVLTAFLGLLVIFPLLGHATWHAYRALRAR